jgi:hypothetical protein
MSAHALIARPAGRRRLAISTRRAAYVVLLASAPLLPHLTSDGFEFPAVSNFWVCLPFCALFLLPLLDSSVLRGRLFLLDLLALLSFIVALGLERPGRVWPVVLIYPPLLYLAARMIAIARMRNRDPDRPRTSPLRLAVPRSWLVAGIVVLSAVHVSWALQGSADTDVAFGGVQGAAKILHGRPLYGAPAGAAAADPHTDTYGPANYEAYLPFAGALDNRSAARVTTLFFDLLTALLLFVLGRQIRGPTAGVLLAYCWLAFPFTLYEDALGFNDSIVAAALVGTVLAARSPARRGVMAALAGWTKLSPLALVPLLAGLSPPAERGARRSLARFAIAFGLATALIFIPALAHGSLSTFVSRTFGFQAHRAPANSIWSFLQGDYLGVPWIASASRVMHGLLAAGTAAFAILLFRSPRRRDVFGIAAASAAVLIAVQLCLSYFSFSYILWFAPLVLVAAVLGCFSDVHDFARGDLRARDQRPAVG